MVEQLPASRMASSYRIVATKVAFADADTPVRSLLLVGAQSGDGTGETAANLAAALATSGRRTVLVDGDDVDGEATALLGLDDRPGLSDVVRGQAELADVIVAHGPDLHVIPVGRSSLEVLDDIAVGRVLDRLLADHDLVVVAGPPTLGSAEALVYARATDASVVVVRRDQTKRDALAHAVESLTLVGTTVLGVVLDARAGGRFRRESSTPPTGDLRAAPVTAAHDASLARPPRSQRMAERLPSAVETRPSADDQARPVRRTGRHRD
jgi:Mrp family chromosome partitioning ATPase